MSIQSTTNNKTAHSQTHLLWRYVSIVVAFILKRLKSSTIVVF